VACYDFVPAQLWVTVGSPFPCRSSCQQCATCNEQCAQCQVNGAGRALWDCTSECACQQCCDDCSGCLSVHPPPYGPYRRLEEQKAQQARKLWSTPSITLTCIDPLCGIIDPLCTATTTSLVDVETVRRRVGSRIEGR
jgi:hypothetical protein